jgi:uncharacterized protein (DUF1015 family)
MLPLGLLTAPQTLTSVEVPDPDASALYVYRVSYRDPAGHAVSHTGVAGLVPVAHVRNGVIRPHEHTDPVAVHQLMGDLLATGVQREPVLLACRHDAELMAQLEVESAATPLVTCTMEDGVQHTIWRVRDPGSIAASVARHATVCIADGHHRTAAVVGAAAARRRAHPEAAGNAAFELLFAVIMPAASLQLRPFHRLVTDLGGHSPASFLRAVATHGQLKEGAPRGRLSDGAIPQGSCALYLAGAWHTLRRHRVPAERVDPVRSLDHDWLQRRLLGPVLGVSDGVGDPRLRCVDGAREWMELEAAVEAGEAALAIAMPAPTVDQVLRVADAGVMMPPKSTWFEPKLRHCLLSHRFAMAHSTSSATDSAPSRRPAPGRRSGRAFGAVP